MKIAIPVSEDKDTIFKRTGQAPLFAIYDDNKFLKVVENGHSHNHDDHEHLEETEHINGHLKDIEGLKGCSIILVQAMGPHMKEALEMLGIKVIKIGKEYGKSAKEAVAKYLRQS